MNGKLNKWKLLFLIFLIIGTVYILHNHKPESYINNNGYIFGTVYNIKYKATDDLHTNIRETMNEVDNSLSLFNKNSIIRAINNNADTVVNAMFAEVFNLAQDISARTAGAFDITVAPLVNAWGFGHSKRESTPDSTQIATTLETVGYKSIALVEGKVQKQHSGTMLDCGAIAKGYGCDVVARLLDSKGVENYMVEIGGEIVTKGTNDKGGAWNISISKPTENPTTSNNESHITVSISGKGMATSGNYRNFYIKDGKKYAHTIDPRTGYPVEHSLLSATVVANDCATADAYATAFMAMGLENAKRVCEKEKIDAYFIYSANDGTLKTHATPGFKKYMK